MLKSSQIALFVVLGIVFWFTGMIMIRLLGPAALTPDNPLMLVMYIGAFPLLFVSLLIASAVSRVALKDMLEPTVIMTFTAVFIDGAIIGWRPDFYGADGGQVMRGAAWLLWGAAAGLLFAWIFARRGRAG